MAHFDLRRQCSNSRQLPEVKQTCSNPLNLGHSGVAGIASRDQGVSSLWAQRPSGGTSVSCVLGHWLAHPYQLKALERCLDVIVH